jgi:hypothetical protein
VTGSEKGDIRLYKEGNFSRANNLLPGIGEPIKAFDVSLDGKWVIATCSTYLLVFSTEMANGKTGFETTMRGQKPVPKKLTINNKDIAKYKIRSVDFTPARFNNGDSSHINQDSIVTSVGPYLITWNFLKVQKGHLQSYKIAILPDQVVDN